MINHTELHTEFLDAGLTIVGTNGDGTPNFVFQDQDQCDTAFNEALPHMIAQRIGLQLNAGGIAELRDALADDERRSTHPHGTAIQKVAASLHADNERRKAVILVQRAVAVDVLRAHVGRKLDAVATALLNS